MVTQTKVVIAIVLALICGSASFIQTVHVLAVWSAPTLTGRIIERKPIRQFGVPRADLTIEIEGTQTEVHARVQRYLMAELPEEVRFRYAGDPSREVFLFEHEEAPYWIVLICWGGAAFFTVMLIASRKSAKVQRLLGMKEGFKAGAQ